MKYEEIEKELKTGELVKLSDWKGFWFNHIKTGKTYVLTKDLEILDTPYEKYKERNDWEIAIPTEEQKEVLYKFTQTF